VDLQNLKTAFLLVLMLSLLSFTASASYTVQNLNVTLSLRPNTSAQVSEVLRVLVSNASVSQYSTNRLALNLTLTDWQKLVGSMLVQHIINPNESLYDFKLFPGPISVQNGQATANIVMAYIVPNVTFVNETSPRQFLYRFNPKVLNFNHGLSGEILTGNTTLTIMVPSGAAIVSAYPPPDVPPSASLLNYKNLSAVSWLYGEPLSKFSFTFLMQQSIQAEVASFFRSVYNSLGAFSYVIIAAAVLLFIVYTYYRASR
jgi:hypothetical protein